MAEANLTKQSLLTTMIVLNNDIWSVGLVAGSNASFQKSDTDFRLSCSPLRIRGLQPDCELEVPQRRQLLGHPVLLPLQVNTYSKGFLTKENKENGVKVLC